MKKQHLLKTMLLLCALVAGSSYGWAQSDKSAVHTSNVTLPTSGTNVAGCTVVIGGNNYDGTKLGKSNTGASASITAPSGTKYIHLHVAAWKDKSTGFTYKVGSADAVSISGITSNSGIANNSPFTFSGDATSSNYYKVITLTTALESNTTITFESSSERVVFWGVNTEAESSTFKVTYNANGADSGDVPTDATDYAKNATVTVKGNTGDLAKEHYTFGGWNTKADGSGSTYAGGGTFTITANTTLYAKWTPNTHDITMPTTDAYGSYTASATDDVPYGTEVELTYDPASGYESYIATWSVNGTPISGNTFDMPDEDVTVTVNVQVDPTITYDFSAINFTGWTNSYTDHTVTYDEATVQLKGSSKQTGTITDVPVTKGGDVILTLRNSGETLKSVKFICKQWSDKAQTITLNYSTNGGTTFSTLTPSVTSTNFTIESNNLPTGTNAVKLTFSSSSNQVGIASAKIGINVPITIGTSKYASYCSTHALTFSTSDVKAYKAKYDSELKKVVLTQVDNVPANGGVILFGNSGDYTVPVIASAAALSNNELVGITSEETVTYNPSSGVYNYILQQGTFKKATDGKLRANRAYLSTTYNVESAGAHELEMVFEGEEGDVTGIAEVSSKKEFTDDFYNLAGQKVANPTKGLYIVNGKKVIIK